MKRSNLSSQKLFSYYSLLNTLEGLVTLWLVAATPANTSTTLVFKVLLIVLLLAVTGLWGYLSYRGSSDSDWIDHQVNKPGKYLTNPKLVISLYAGLAGILLILVFLALIHPELMVLNLVIKRLTYPLVWLGLWSLQSILLLNRMVPFSQVLQQPQIANTLTKAFSGKEESEGKPGLFTGLDRIIYPAALVITVLIILNFFLVSLPNPTFSCDSYQYWTLSRTIDNDFYKSSSIVQQYIFETEYSVDAPPFYPILIWAVNQLHDFKIYGGFVLNFFVTFGLLGMLIKLSRVLFKHTLFGVLVFLVLFSYVPFQQEISAARIIPLAILYQLVMIYYVLTHEKLGYKGFAWIGFLAGLSILSRFDFLNASLVLGLVLAAIEKEKWFPKLVLYYSMVVLTFSPWMYYSYSHFGTPMISKDVRTVTSTVIVHSNNYFPPGQEPPTIFDFPLEGIFATLTRIRMVVEGILATAWASSFGSLFIITFVVILVLAVLQALVQISRGKPAFELSDNMKRLGLFGIVYLAIWFTTALSGYALDRYYSPIYLYLSLLLFAIINQLFPQVLSRKRLSSPLVQVVLLLPVLAFAFSSPKFYQQDYSPSQLETAIQSQWQLEPEHAALDYYQGQPVVLVADGHNCCKFGAVSGIKTYCMPFNLDDDNIDQFIQDYDDITHVLIPTTPTYRFLSRHLDLLRVDENIPMYELVR